MAIQRETGYVREADLTLVRCCCRSLACRNVQRAAGESAGKACGAEALPLGSLAVIGKVARSMGQDPKCRQWIGAALCCPWLLSSLASPGALC
jgi:hypothetical protein